MDSATCFQQQQQQQMYYCDPSPISLDAEDGLLVYQHLQQTLQVQTDLKNQQHASLLGLDGLYSSIANITPSDDSADNFTYLQFMQNSANTAPYYTTSFDANNHSDFDFTSPFHDNSVTAATAGLDAAANHFAPDLLQEQQLLYHPFDIIDSNHTRDNMMSDYYNTDMLTSLNCNTNTGFDTSSNCFNNDMSTNSYLMPPLYSSPSIHETAAPLSALNTNHHNRYNMGYYYRNHSTPMLSASYSFSSFSSSSSNEEENEFGLLNPDKTLSNTTGTSYSPLLATTAKPTSHHKKQYGGGPKKSASISCFAERRKKKMSSTPSSSSLSGYSRKNSNSTITSDLNKTCRKLSLQHRNSNASTDSLSYYLSNQHISSIPGKDTIAETGEEDEDEEDEEDEEDHEGDVYHHHAITSSSGHNSLNSNADGGCKKGRNVDKACNHCKRSHLRCDNVRPCRRCVATGKIGCQDVKHKPRGRPRLQKRL